jgi:hypothetical protein
MSRRGRLVPQDDLASDSQHFGQPKSLLDSRKRLTHLWLTWAHPAARRAEHRSIPPNAPLRLGSARRNLALLLYPDKAAPRHCPSCPAAQSLRNTLPQACPEPLTRRHLVRRPLLPTLTSQVLPLQDCEPLHQLVLTLLEALDILTLWMYTVPALSHLMILSQFLPRR